MFVKGDKMSKIPSRLKNWFNSYLKSKGIITPQDYTRLKKSTKHVIFMVFIGIIELLAFIVAIKYQNSPKPKIPNPITIKGTNTKIEGFTYSGEKTSEFAINRFTVNFMDNNKPNCEFDISSSPWLCEPDTCLNGPIVVFNGLKNYADIYNQNNLDFNSSKYNFLPVAFYKSFKSSWKDDNDGKAIFIYASPGKPIACFEGSHVSISSTAAKEVKEIHIDGHRAIIINSTYSVYKVGKLKDMYYRRIRLQKRDSANK